MKPFTNVARGYSCDINAPVEYVLRTEEEWKSVFQQAFPERSFADHGAGYDFSSQTLIAVFLGKSPERSAIKIEEVREHAENLEVIVSRNVKVGGPACSPYHIARVDTVGKKVRFEYQDKQDLAVSEIKPR